MEELRCGHNLHGVLMDDHTLEVKCNRLQCGAKKGIIVLHRFDLATGELVATNRYQDPLSREVNNATSRKPASVRNS